MTSLRTTAARLTSLGIGVVPLHWAREDGSCSCGDPDCRSIGKHPLNKNGASDPILDPETATLQWDELSNANIGIVPGVSRLVAVDFDSESARDRFREIADAATLEAMRQAPTVKTGKGWHVYFSDPRGEYPPSVGKKDDVGIDIRAGCQHPRRTPEHARERSRLPLAPGRAAVRRARRDTVARHIH